MRSFVFDKTMRHQKKENKRRKKKFSVEKKFGC